MLCIKSVLITSCLVLFSRSLNSHLEPLTCNIDSLPRLVSEPQSRFFFLSTPSLAHRHDAFCSPLSSFCTLPCLLGSSAHIISNISTIPRFLSILGSAALVELPSPDCGLLQPCSYPHYFCLLLCTIDCF